MALLWVIGFKRSAQQANCVFSPAEGEKSLCHGPKTFNYMDACPKLTSFRSLKQDCSHWADASPCYASGSLFSGSSTCGACLPARSPTTPCSVITLPVREVAWAGPLCGTPVMLGGRPSTQMPASVMQHLTSRERSSAKGAFRTSRLAARRHFTVLAKSWMRSLLLSDPRLKDSYLLQLQRAGERWLSSMD